MLICCNHATANVWLLPRSRVAPADAPSQTTRWASVAHLGAHLLNRAVTDGSGRAAATRVARPIAAVAFVRDAAVRSRPGAGRDGRPAIARGELNVGANHVL